MTSQHVLQSQKKALHRGGPGLLRGFFQEDQLPKQVDVAQRVRAAIACIGGPSIMDRSSLISWQDAVRIQRFGSSFGMDVIMSQPAGRGHMHPGAPASLWDF